MIEAPAVQTMRRYGGRGKKVREAPDIWDRRKGTVGKASTASQPSNIDSASNFYPCSLFLKQTHSLLFTQRAEKFKNKK